MLKEREKERCPPALYEQSTQRLLFLPGQTQASRASSWGCRAHGDLAQSPEDVEQGLATSATGEIPIGPICGMAILCEGWRAGVDLATEWAACGGRRRSCWQVAEGKQK